MSVPHPPTAGPSDQLCLHEVSLTYKRRRAPALDRVSLLLDERSTVIVGPNGAGKSTLMKVLTGQLRADSGSVERHPQIGYCPQRPVAIPAFTCQEQVAYAGWLAGMARRATSVAADQALHAVDLDKLAGRPTTTLSGGQAARLGIACALVTAPRFLLLDEPTAALDPLARSSVREVLIQLAAEGVTILASSHTAADVAAPFERLVLMHQGRVTYDGTTSDFFSTSHSDPVAAEFARALSVR